MVPTSGRHEFRTKDGELQAIVELIEGNPNGLWLKLRLSKFSLGR